MLQAGCLIVYVVWTIMCPETPVGCSSGIKQSYATTFVNVFLTLFSTIFDGFMVMDLPTVISFSNASPTSGDSHAEPVP